MNKGELKMDNNTHEDKPRIEFGDETWREYIRNTRISDWWDKANYFKKGIVATVVASIVAGGLTVLNYRLDQKNIILANENSELVPKAGRADSLDSVLKVVDKRAMPFGGLDQVFGNADLSRVYKGERDRTAKELQGLQKKLPGIRNEGIAAGKYASLVQQIDDIFEEHPYLTRFSFTSTPIDKDNDGEADDGFSYRAVNLKRTALNLSNLALEGLLKDLKRDIGVLTTIESQLQAYMINVHDITSFKHGDIDVDIIYDGSGSGNVGIENKTTGKSYSKSIVVGKERN
jgi:hypothetical protein